MRWMLCAVIVLLASVDPASAGGDEGRVPTYVTTPFLEPDRCTTAWVIQTYVAPEASFLFWQREEIPRRLHPGVVLYDLPEAELKRDARRATVEVLVERERLEDPFVHRLARLVHDIEINAWATRREPDSPKFEEILVAEFRNAKTVELALDRCFQLIDDLRAVDGDVGLWIQCLEPEEVRKY